MVAKPETACANRSVAPRFESVEEQLGWLVAHRLFRGGGQESGPAIAMAFRRSIYLVEDIFGNGDVDAHHLCGLGFERYQDGDPAKIVIVRHDIFRG